MARASEFSFRIMPEACILAAIAILIIPLKWFLAWLLAAMWHELFHCFALLLCGRRVNGIRIGTNGAKLLTGFLSERETLLCSLSGPVGGLLLLQLAGRFPRLAVCALVQSVFNLLPVYPLDGGQALRSIMRLHFSEHTAQRVCTAVETLFAFAAVCFGFAAGFLWNYGVFPILALWIFLMYRKK